MDDRLERLNRHIAQAHAMGLKIGYHEEHQGEVIEQALLDMMRHIAEHHPEMPAARAPDDGPRVIYIQEDGGAVDEHGNRLVPPDFPCNFLMVTDLRLGGQLSPDEYRAEMARLEAELARGEHR